MATSIGKLLYTNLSPLGFQNYYLDQYEIDYSTLPMLSNYKYGINVNNLQTLVDLYQTQISANIESLNKLNFNPITNSGSIGIYPATTLFNETIVQLRNSYAAMINLAKQYSQNISQLYSIFTTPYKMSIRQLCFLNNINFNSPDNLNTLFILNPTILQNINFIQANVEIKIPNSIKGK